MANPSLTTSSSSSSSIPFSSSPSLNNSNNLNPLLLNLHQQQISSPISTKILQIPSQQPQQYPPQQFDQLVALAHFQQMLERIKASETAKASQLLENNSVKNKLFKNYLSLSNKLKFEREKKGN